MMAETDRSEMYSKEFFGSTDPNFNLDAAVQMYEFFNSEPEVAKALLHMHAHQEVAKALILEEDLIGDLVYAKYAARKDVVKRAVLNGVINKSMDDRAVDEISKTMDLIQKALGDDYTSWERSQNVKQQRRGPGGRFVKMGTTKIDLPPGVGASTGARQRSYWDAQTNAYDEQYVRRFQGGNKDKRPPTISQNKSFNAAHSAAYLQIASALQRLDPTDLAMAEVHYKTYTTTGSGKDKRTKTGTLTRTKIGMEPGDFFTEDEAGRGEIPVSIDWYMDTDSMDMGRFDILTGVGLGDEAALDTANMLHRSGPAATKFNTDMQDRQGEYGSMKYGGLKATADMIDAIGGDKLSPKGKAALAAAQYVGQHGAEAEKILGPTSRRAAYRYRGVERKPDEKLERAMMMSVQGAASTDDARESLIHPKDVTEQVGLEFVHQDEHSPFIRYWQSNLPSSDYIQLHLDSGTTPPSQGVVLDRKGQVVTQAVGYGDDHYLPFNLKNLTRSNRGEWVRTRTMGGPTTEDIYAALISGTRSVTVVSHSGVYNIEFDESFRGGRRFNDKSKRMVRRYAQLLDTLDAESTTLKKVPQDRLDELRATAAREIVGEGKAATDLRQKRYEELKAVETKNPTPSKAQRAIWTAEFGERAAQRINPDDDEASWERAKASLAIRYDTGPLEDDDAIELLGLQDQHARFMKTKENEYRTAQEPLKLNGQGYYFALKALQEQFPAYIKRVEWYPTDDTYGRDRGYVPHNFNRPKAAKEGFWSTEIEGYTGEIKNLKGEETGKVKAHHTNYQNYAARIASGERAKGAPGRTEAPPDRTPDAPSTGGTDTPASTGVRLSTVRASRKATGETAERVEGLGDRLSGVVINITTNPNDEGTPFGESDQPGARRLTNWEETKGELSDPAVVAEVLKEMKDLFEGKTPLGDAVSIADKKGELKMMYRKGVLPTVLMPLPANPRAALSNEGMFLFTDSKGQIDTRYEPGRAREVYEVELPNTDPDLKNWRDRGQLFGDFPREFLAMEQAASRVRMSEEATSPVVWGGRTYLKEELPELDRVAKQDLMGFLKARQLERIAGVSVVTPVEIPNTVEEAEKILREKEKAAEEAKFTPHRTPTPESKLPPRPRRDPIQGLNIQGPM